MFERWKKRVPARQVPPVESAAPAAPQCSSGEDGAGPAQAGPAEAESPEPCGSDTRGRPRRSAAERSRLLAELASSGLTPEEFAARNALAPKTLKAWVRATKAAHEKDGRYRRRFTPEERRATIEAFLKSERKRLDFARLWGCSPASLDKWLRRYRDEGPKGLETRKAQRQRASHHPARLPDNVRAEILAVREAEPSFGVNRMADHLRRFCGLDVSASTVRNVLREAGVPPQPAPKRRTRVGKPLPRRFERSRPGELWQSDITSYVLRRQGRRVYLTVFLDDHSRFVVAFALATHQRTPLVTEPLLEGIARFGKPREVLTDQGRQYYAWRGKSGFQKLLAKEGIQHVVSRAHHPETLGKCERLWKSIGIEFWDRAAPQDLEDARRRLAHWFAHYNHFRPHQGIDGLVPADRFFGAGDTLRAALERELSQNELRLALGEAPRKPVYLVGQIGDERIALHGERGRVVIETQTGGRRELALEELGIEGANDDGRDDDERSERGAEAEETPRAHGPQAHGLQDATEAGLAGAGPVGECATGAEGRGASGLHADPRVLAREEDQERGGRGALGEAPAGVAALPAGALGDAGGPPGAAAPSGGPGDLRGARGREPGGAEEAHQRAREGAPAHGGPGAGPAHRPVGEPEPGIEPQGGLDECEEKPQEESAEVDELRARSACESERSCAGNRSPGGRFLRWLKRTE
jgi:transposase InsO family protein